MVQYLSKREVLTIHHWAIEEFGGTTGIRDEGLIDSSLAQPAASFSSVDLHPTLAAKAAALGYSLLKNHAFVDGNKRVAAWSMETFLEVNGHHLAVDNKEFEREILAATAGELSKDDFFEWVARRLVASSA